MSQKETQANISRLDSGQSKNFGVRKANDAPVPFINMDTQPTDMDFAKSYTSLNTNKVSQVFKKNFTCLNVRNCLESLILTKIQLEELKEVEENDEMSRRASIDQKMGNLSQSGSKLPKQEESEILDALDQDQLNFLKNYCKKLINLELKI